MIEVVSPPNLLMKPRYWDGRPLDARTWWTRPDLVALKALIIDNADPVRSAHALGREPRHLADKAYRTGIPPPRSWRAFLTRKQMREEPTSKDALQYPYIAKVRGEHADLLAVNALVPRGLPDFMRADVCQEIMLALLDGSVTLDELRSDQRLVRSFVSRSRRENEEMGGYALSLDAPMRDGRSWYEVMPDTPGHSSLAR